jgi:hypothetical protein
VGGKARKYARVMCERDRKRERERERGIRKTRAREFLAITVVGKTFPFFKLIICIFQGRCFDFGTRVSVQEI